MRKIGGLCTEKDCERPFCARGLCRLHYMRQLRKTNNRYYQSGLKKHNEFRAKKKRIDTPRKKLVALYQCALARVEGRSGEKESRHRWFGRPIMPRDEFIAWGLAHPEYNKLYAAWKHKNYEIGLAPSPDRINTSLGYTVDNIQRVTSAENCRRAMSCA